MEPRPTLHEGEARKVLGASPEEASTLKPGGEALLPWPSWHLCTSAGRAPVCFRTSECLSSEVF